MNKKKAVLWLLLTVLVSGILVFVLGKLVQPKYMSGVLEGAMVQEYYQEENDHDVIFIGDCEAYENFSPVAMWEECGITSYIRGSASQTVWQSYWLLAETFSRETPKVVVFNVDSMQESEPVSEAYNRMTIDGMRLSRYKLGAIQASMTEDETVLSYLIPLLRYHSRWSELTEEDLTYWFHRDPVTVAGYLMRVDTEPMAVLPNPSILSDPDFSDVCWDYLDQIRLLCEENGASLVLVKSSSLWPAWYEEWDYQIAEYAEQYGLTYYNFINRQEAIGIDFATDTYDGGLHLNLSGAEKLSRYFAQLLAEEQGVEDHRQDSVLAADWEQKCSDYYELKAAQEQELEEYGYLKSWTLGE